jgi:hypothetical protein
LLIQASFIDRCFSYLVGTYLGWSSNQILQVFKVKVIDAEIGYFWPLSHKFCIVGYWLTSYCYEDQGILCPECSASPMIHVMKLPIIGGDLITTGSVNSDPTWCDMIWLLLNSRRKLQTVTQFMTKNMSSFFVWNEIYFILDIIMSNSRIFSPKFEENISDF